MATQHFAGTSQMNQYTAKVLTSLTTLSTTLITSRSTTLRSSVRSSLRSSLSTILITQVVTQMNSNSYQPGLWWSELTLVGPCSSGSLMTEAETVGGCGRIAGVACAGAGAGAGAAVAVAAAGAASTAEELMRCRVLGNSCQAERLAAGPVTACGSLWSDLPMTDDIVHLIPAPVPDIEVHCL